MFPPQGSVEGNPFWDEIRDQLLGEPSNETKACHKPKPILFSTGEVRMHRCVPWEVQRLLVWARFWQGATDDACANPYGEEEGGREGCMGFEGMTIESKNKCCH